jgi:mersacidin/lichenicidin family type 2 lantibiotic
MKSIDIVRAWKDARYREGLTQGERQGVPANPAGIVELTDEQLKQASGLSGAIVTTGRTCTDFTNHRFHCC